MGSQLKILWLESGDLYTIRRGIESGKKLGIQVDAADILDLIISVEGNGASISKDLTNIVDAYDGIIVRSFMPYISETITIARLFVENGKAVIDASLTDEGYAMSKMHDYVVLSKSGVGVPVTHQCFDPARAEKYAGEFGYPCILKGIHGAEGRHVYKVDSTDQFHHTFWRYKPGEIMVQEFLPAEVDYRVMAIGYKALPIMVRRRPRPGEFRTNFEYDEEITPLSTDEYPDMKALAEQAARTLRREFAGIDIRYRGSDPLVLEVNRRPGFKGFEEATGFDVAGAFIKYAGDRCLSRTSA